ncbi:MAG: DUF4190 domain-containing protein [Actinomycetota bacterium]
MEQPGDASAATSEARASWLGVCGFVLAVLGLVGILPVVGSVLGLVLGRVALRQAATRPLRGGRGLALAAFVLGLATLVVITVVAATYALVLAFGPS